MTPAPQDEHNNPDVMIPGHAAAWIKASNRTDKQLADAIRMAKKLIAKEPLTPMLDEIVGKEDNNYWK